MIVFVTVGSGLFGAGIAWALGLAAPFITGPALAVAFVSLMGVKCHIPLYFRNTVFLIIGIVLGSGVTPDILVEEIGEDFKIKSDKDNQLNYAIKLFNS